MKSSNTSTTMDCNNCEHLNITEAEQKQRGNTLVPHICTKYNQRVIHRATNKIHNEYIYPCDKCLKEKKNMIEKLDKNNLTDTDMADKINEIIDFLNDTFLMRVNDGQYGTLTTGNTFDTTDCSESLSTLGDCIACIDLESNVKCPHCGASYYAETYHSSTAVYYPPIWKDGVNINPDRNKLTTHCECLNCGGEFDV